MMPMALLMESFKENAMLMDIPDLDMDLLIKGKKKIIVQKKLPGREVIDASIFRQKHPRVYLYNQNCGVFGESYCKLSFDNIEYTGEYPRKFYFYRKIDGYSRKQYKENPVIFEKEFEQLISKISLEGTCLSKDDFRKLIMYNNYIFFIIKDLIIYENPLPIEEFYITRWGKNGAFEPATEYKKPRGWCYAVKKTEELEELVKRHNELLLDYGNTYDVF